MGLGLLLCAYFVLTFMSVGIGNYGFLFLTYFVGAAVTISAVGKLKPYNPRFAWLLPFSVLYGVLALYFAVDKLADVFLWNLPLISGGVIVQIVGGLQTVAELGYTLVALLALAELCASVGLDRRRDKGMRNIAFVVILAIGQAAIIVITLVGHPAGMARTEVLPVLQALLFVYQLVVYLFNSLFFYGCFSNICPQGEEFGKPSKPSRFRFINEMNRKLDEKNEQARLEYEKTLAEQNKKFSAKNNDRHHKKKK